MAYEGRCSQNLRMGNVLDSIGRASEEELPKEKKKKNKALKWDDPLCKE